MYLAAHQTQIKMHLRNKKNAIFLDNLLDGFFILVTLSKLNVNQTLIIVGDKPPLVEALMLILTVYTFS